MKFVLMPGLDGTGQLFAPLLEALGEDRCAITRYPTTARTVDEHLRAVPLPDERFVVVAESFSGPLAVRLAARSPPHLAGVVLVATFARAPLRSLLPLAARTGWLMPLMPHALVRRALLGPRADATLSALLRQALASVPPTTFGARLGLLASLDVRAELAGLTVPVLALEAADDRVVPSRLTRELTTVQPRAKHVVLPGPHLLLQHSPRPVVDTLAAFVAAV